MNVSLGNSLDALGASLVTLPSNLTSANLTLLSSLLHTLSGDLGSIYNQSKVIALTDVASNASLVNTTMGPLVGVLQSLPGNVTDGATQTQLQDLLEFALARFSVLTYWEPEYWTLSLFFVCAMVKRILAFTLVHDRAAERVRQCGLRNEMALMSLDTAKLILEKPVREATAHIIRIFTLVAALVLQCVAWRLFSIPTAEFRFEDEKHLEVAIKLFFVGTLSELYLVEGVVEHYVTVFLTLGLLFMTEAVMFVTKDPKLLSFMQYFLLQATADLFYQAAVAKFHLYTYLSVQEAQPERQKTILLMATHLMRFQAVFTWLQRLVPLGFVYYWFNRAWTDMQRTAVGRAWLGVTFVILLLLTFLFIKQSDDVAPVAAFMHRQLVPGPVPEVEGPLWRLVSRCVFPHGQRQASSDIYKAADENELAAMKQGLLDPSSQQPAFLSGPGTVETFHTGPRLPSQMYEAEKETPPFSRYTDLENASAKSGVSMSSSSSTEPANSASLNQDGTSH